MVKTNFQNSWNKDKSWLVPVKNNFYEAMCRVWRQSECNKCYWSY